MASLSARSRSGRPSASLGGRPRSSRTTRFYLQAAALIVCLLLSCFVLQATRAQGGEATPPTDNGGGTDNSGGSNAGGDSGIGGGNPPATSPQYSSGGPTAASGTFPVWAIIVTAVAGGLVLLFFVLKTLNPKGTHFDVIIFFLAVLDFGSDVWFIASLRNRDGFQTAFRLGIVFTSVPFLLNFLSLMYLIRREISHNLAFRRWLQSNFAPFTAVVLTSCSQMDAMFVLDSHVCGLSFLKAPWSEHMTTLLRMFGFVTLLFEDIPQAALQIYMLTQSNYQLVNVIALCSSIITIVFGMTKRLLVCCVYHVEQTDLEAQKSAAQAKAQGNARSFPALNTGGHDPSHTLAKPEGIPVTLHGPLGGIHHTDLALAAALGAVGARDKLHDGIVTRVSPTNKDRQLVEEREPGWTAGEKETSMVAGTSAPGGPRSVRSHETDTAIRPAFAHEGERSSSHIKLQEPSATAVTPEGSYRRLGTTAAPVSAAAPGLGAAQLHPSAPQQLSGPASVTKVFSSSASGDSFSKSSPSPALVSGSEKDKIVPHSTLAAPSAMSGGGLGAFSVSTTPKQGSSRRGSLDGVGDMPPALPPRPPSAHSSPLSQRRTLASSTTGAAATTVAPMSSHAHVYYTPQAAHRSLQQQPFSSAASASPPIPARPLSATHASSVAATRSSSPAFTAQFTGIPAPAPAQFTSVFGGGGAPAFTVRADDANLDNLTFASKAGGSGDFVAKDDLSESQPKTLADLLKA